MAIPDLTKCLRLATAVAAGLAATMIAPPAAASSSAADYFRSRAMNRTVPELLSRSDKAYYADLFQAIDRQDWSRVDAMLAERDDGPLHHVARAEYYLAATSPRVELPAIQAWRARGSRLPHAEQMGRLGLTRGMMSAPYLPREQSFVRQPYASKRTRPSTVDDGTMPGEIRRAILDRISNDDPDGARQLLDGVDAMLSPPARAEWRQRVAFSYYIENDDPAALAMAQTVREGSGAWVAEGDWVAGLAAWRLGDCETAADNFERAARGSTNHELTAAAFYWSSRALVRCRQPEKAAEQLRGAARLDETLYGMLAREQLGQALPQNHAGADFAMEDWHALREVENVRIAVALAEIGRDRLADEVLRHEARIGDPDNYDELSRLSLIHISEPTRPY